MIYTTTVKALEGREDELYIDLPVALFTEMGWNENTNLIWVVNEDGDVRIRARTYDTEPGYPVEFISVKEREDNNDSSNET
jgi:hypothetical protein